MRCRKAKVYRRNDITDVGGAGVTYIYEIENNNNTRARVVDDDHVRSLLYYRRIIVLITINYRYRHVRRKPPIVGEAAVGRGSAARVRVFAPSNITKTGFAENEHHAVAAAGSKPVKTEGRRDGDTCAHTLYNIHL